MNHYNEPEIINVGSGQEVTIGQLAALVGEVVGFKREITFNSAMPDGTPRKFLDVSRLSSLGWKSRISLRDGISETYTWFLKNAGRYRC